MRFFKSLKALAIIFILMFTAIISQPVSAEVVNQYPVGSFFKSPKYKKSLKVLSENLLPDGTMEKLPAIANPGGWTFGAAAYDAENYFDPTYSSGSLKVQDTTPVACRVDVIERGKTYYYSIWFKADPAANISVTWALNYNASSPQITDINGTAVSYDYNSSNYSGEWYQFEVLFTVPNDASIGTRFSNYFVANNASTSTPLWIDQAVLIEVAMENKVDFTNVAVTKDGKTLSKLESGNIDVVGTVVNRVSDASTAAILAVLYNENGRIEKIACAQEELQAVADSTVDIPLSITVDNAAGRKLKLYLMTSPESMERIGNDIVITEKGIQNLITSATVAETAEVKMDEEVLTDSESGQEIGTGAEIVQPEVVKQNTDSTAETEKAENAQQGHGTAEPSEQVTDEQTAAQDSQASQQ